MEQVKGVVFDLDGVIVDTAQYHFKAWKKLADALGIPFSKADNEKFKGVSRKRCLEILLELGGRTATPEQFAHWLVTKNADYLEYIAKMDASQILPGVPRVLEQLRKAKIPLAVGSASKNARPILEKVGLLSYFEAVVDGTQVTQAKPDPEVFLIAAARLGVEPGACAVFEDAIAGIEAAHTAGMLAIGIGTMDILGAADHCFRDFTEIGPDFLDQLIDKG